MVSSCSTSMDLIGINNEIVRMRKSVDRARVQIINSLTRRIKKLNMKKGSTEQKNKSARKAERFLREIQILRHFNRDKLSKFALKNWETDTLDDKMPDGINPNTMSERTIEKILQRRVCLRVASHPLIKADVKSIRQLHPDLEQQAVKVLQVLGQKQKKKDQKLINKEITPLRTDAAKTSREKADKSKKERRQTADQTAVETDPGECEQVVDLDKLVKHQGAMIITRVKTDQDNEDEDDEDKEDEELVDSSMHHPIEAIKKASSVVKDSFFMGGADESESEDSDPNSQDNDDENFTAFQSSSSSRWRASRGRGARGKPHQTELKHGRDTFIEPRGRSRGGRGAAARPSRANHPGPSRGNDGRRHMQSVGPSKMVEAKKHTEFSKPEALHPSWRAKKEQQKQGLVSFQGKKTVFSDLD